MINTAKHRDILDPLTDIKAPIHIIGCGAIGSRLAELLTRLGVEQLYLYDFDTVEAYNITNQLYLTHQIGQDKLEALSEILLTINPDIIIEKKGKYVQQKLSGYVFLCVDSIETRQQIVENNKHNTYINAMLDFRMGLYNAQLYTSVWSPNEIAALQKTMEFTHTEAKENIPKSPCGTVLSVAPTICTIVSLGIINFIKLCTKVTTDRITIVDLYTNQLMTI